MPSVDQSIRSLLRPRSVAVVGASPRPGSRTKTLVKAVRSLGFSGEIYLVNPRYEQIDDLTCYPSLDAIPETPDCAAYLVPDERLVSALEGAAECGVPSAVMFGRAYGQLTDGRSIQDSIAAIGRSAGMSICGANCAGYLNLVDGVLMTMGPFASLGKASGASFISHSGASWTGLICNKRGIGFDFGISAGQELVTGVADYLEYILERDSTRVVACVLETLRHPAAFLQAAEKADRKDIPLVVLKLGRSEIGKRFGVSHSGAISGETAAYEAVFRQNNIIQVKTLDEMLDTVELFCGDRRPQGPGIAIGAESGGERQLIVDIATDIGLKFPDLSESTNKRLEALLDPGLEPANPLDYWGDGRDVMAPCLSAMAEDPAVGMVMMSSNMPANWDSTRATANTISGVRQDITKPIALIGNIATTMSEEDLKRVRAAGIPVLMGTESGLRAAKHFLEFCLRPKRHKPHDVQSDKGAGILARYLPSERSAMPSSAEGFALLDVFGVPTAPFSRVVDERDLVKFFEREGAPVVLKIDDPRIPHKSEVGGVLVNLTSEGMVRDAFQLLRERHPDAPIIVQKQLSGRELILGMTTDRDFGPMITVGLGGIFTEVFKDVTVLPPPITRSEALAGLRRLKAFPILEGVRGERGANLDAITDAIVAFGHLAVCVKSGISEIEVNPLLVGPDGVVAVDCLVVRSEEKRDVATV